MRHTSATRVSAGKSKQLSWLQCTRQPAQASHLRLLLAGCPGRGSARLAPILKAGAHQAKLLGAGGARGLAVDDGLPRQLGPAGLRKGGRPRVGQAAGRRLLAVGLRLLSLLRLVGLARLGVAEHLRLRAQQRLWGGRW